MPVNIGSLIRHQCRTHFVKPVDLGKSIELTVDAVYKIFKSTEIKTGLLLKISIALKHDFFKYYQAQLDPNIYEMYKKLDDNYKLVTKYYETVQLENELLKKVLKLPKNESEQPK